MVLVMDVAPNDGSLEDPLEDKNSVNLQESSSFLRFAYTKARSMTGTSCSTEGSSLSLDASESFDNSEKTGEDDCPAVEDIEETFYDCRSQASSMVLATTDRNDQIAMYSNGMCVYPDGSPAFVPPGHCISSVSYDFLEFHDFNEAKAKQMWQAMIKWREETAVWKIHRRPNIRFDIVKKYYPGCYHGYDKELAVVEYSFPGGMVPKKLIPDIAALEEIMDHHKFMQEYLFNCLYTHEESWREVGQEPMKLVPGESTTRGIVLIIDVKGAGVNVMTGNVFTFMKRMIHNSTSYYPAMAKQVIVINSPFWVAGVFRTLKPLLPDGLPIEIVSEKNTMDVLRVYLDEDQIPMEYGGKSAYPLHKHPFEFGLLEKAKEAASYGKHLKEMSMEVVQREQLDDDAASVLTMCSTSSDGNADSPRDSYVDNATTSITSPCSKLPFSHCLTRHQEAVVMLDGTCDDMLDLTPAPPKLDVIGVTSDIWKTFSKGFECCGAGAKSNQ